jgi:hypothetical protein
MTLYGIPDHPRARYRVDLHDERSDYWIGYEVANYGAAEDLIALQPDTGHRFRIVRIAETVEWESS